MFCLFFVSFNGSLFNPIISGASVIVFASMKYWPFFCILYINISKASFLFVHCPGFWPYNTKLYVYTDTHTHMYVYTCIYISACMMCMYMHRHTVTNISPFLKTVFDGDHSNSSWAEMRPLVIGSYSLNPLTTSMKQRLILQYLTPLGDYHEVS